MTIAAGLHRVGRDHMSIIELIVWIAAGGLFGALAGLALRNDPLQSPGAFVAVGIFGALALFGGGLSSPLLSPTAPDAGISLGGVLAVVGIAGVLVALHRYRDRHQARG
jgi:hypothetical protein